MVEVRGVRRGAGCPGGEGLDLRVLARHPLPVFPGDGLEGLEVASNRGGDRGAVGLAGVRGGVSRVCRLVCVVRLGVWVMS